MPELPELGLAWRDVAVVNKLIHLVERKGMIVVAHHFVQSLTHERVERYISILEHRIQHLPRRRRPVAALALFLGLLE